MCGIAGIINFSHSNNIRAAIHRMTTCIAHRGPDAHKIYIDENIALGHRRLAIIDLKISANQPMDDFTQRYKIIYNGEIYNYQEVKAQLPDYPFRTDSDTEVILAAYSTWGLDGLLKLNGMFAFAIWDSLKKELFIARDRLGKKPFYYYLTEDHFIFSSEIRSLLSSELVPRVLDENNLPEFFTYQAPMNDHTLVLGVKQLKAGHFAIVKDGVIREEPFWSYAEVQPTHDDYSTAKNRIKEIFIDSVRLRMISDVPVGAFLSGGIDSSLVVACMAELSEGPINTFTISFDEKEFDESAFAHEVATKYNTRHQRIIIKPEEFLESIDEILSAMDSPSGDGPNTYLVAKRTRAEGIKVALSGLGGDELFAGYNKFLLYQRIMRNKWILKIPSFAREQLARVIINSTGKHKNSKLADLFTLEDWNLATVYPQLRRSYRKDDINKLLSRSSTADQIESRLALIDKATCWMGKFSKSTIGEMETYTRDVLLRDTDQMAMAHGLEVRVPFFDYRLVEYVLSLPDEYKYPSKPKKLLVESLAPRLPFSISNRKKMGFTFPMQKWLRNELSDMAQQKLSYLSERKEFNGEVIKKTWKQFSGGDNRILWTHIWQMVVLSDWMQRNNL